jgi:hypothetical protein
VQTKRGECYNNEYCFVFSFATARSPRWSNRDTDLEERVLGNYDDVVSQMAAQ